MFCKHCGKKILKESDFCPKCGGKIKEAEEVEKKPKINSFILFGIIAVVMVIVILLALRYLGINLIQEMEYNPNTGEYEGEIEPLSDEPPSCKIKLDCIRFFQIHKIPMTAESMGWVKCVDGKCKVDEPETRDSGPVEEEVAP